MDVAPVKPSGKQTPVDLQLEWVLGKMPQKVRGGPWGRTHRSPQTAPPQRPLLGEAGAGGSRSSLNRLCPQPLPYGTPVWERPGPE